MPARRPEELDQLFAQAVNAGDLNALVALYEPGACWNPEPDHIVTGIDAIREGLASLLSLNPRLTLESRNLNVAGDLALTTAKWHLTATDPDGNPVEFEGQSVEVARRQPDGAWLFVIDNPFGLGWDS